MSLSLGCSEGFAWSSQYRTESTKGLWGVLHSTCCKHSYANSDSSESSRSGLLCHTQMFFSSWVSSLISVVTCKWYRLGKKTAIFWSKFSSALTDTRVNLPCSFVRSNPAADRIHLVRSFSWPIPTCPAPLNCGSQLAGASRGLAYLHSQDIVHGNRA